MKELILASSSPRRRELSLRKARAVWAQQPDQRDLAVIGSDTVVYIDGEILGKPITLK